MGKGYNNYMTKKPFHPGSKANIKRTWMAEQRADNEKKKQEELKTQYEKEQDLYNNRALLSTESKDKLELNFMYEAPPGAKRERQKEDDEPEYKFEWQRKYNAPREDYAKGNTDIRDQPFGIPVRNVRCIKCHKWGHINTDKECPLYSHASTSSMPTTSMDPLELMRQMREDGYNLKQSVLGHCMNPKNSNQQFIPSDESDPEMEFLKSLTPKQKRKLLKKLNKLSKKQKKKDEDSKKKRSKRKEKAKRKAVTSTSESEDKPKHRKKKSKAKQELSSDESNTDSSVEDDDKSVQEKGKKQKENMKKLKPAKQSMSCTQSDDDTKYQKHKKKLPDSNSSSDESVDDDADSRKVKKTQEKVKISDMQTSSNSAGHKKRKIKHDNDGSGSESESECGSSPPKKAKNSNVKHKEKKRLHSDPMQSRKQSKKDSELSLREDISRKPQNEKNVRLHTDEYIDISIKLGKSKQKERAVDAQCDVFHKNTSSEEKWKAVHEDLSLTKKEKYIKQNEQKEKNKTYNSSEDSSNEKCQQKCQSSSLTQGKDVSSRKQISDGENKKSVPSTSKIEETQSSITDKAYKDSPLHPDGFDHEFPQRTSGDENSKASLSSKYQGDNHDRFRNLHRHRRSPSVKHKYRK